MRHTSLVGLLMTAVLWGPALAAENNAGLVGSAVQLPTELDESPFKKRISHQKLIPKKVALSQMLTSTKRPGSSAPPGTPRQIGEKREVEPLDDVAKTSKGLQWVPTPQGGWVAAISISSPQAKGARLGILVRALPRNATLRFYVPDSPTVFEISGAAILKLIQANIDSGDKSDAARTYWGPTIYGESTTLELEIPVGVSQEEVRIAIPTLSHLFTSPLEIGSGNKTNYGVSTGTSESCEVDSMCLSTTATERKSVAHMQYPESVN